MPAEADSDEEDEEEDEEVEDDESFASIDDLDGQYNVLSSNAALISLVDDNEGATHLHELSKLAEKDPEFFKYLQENDTELLDFDPDAMDQDADEDGDEDNEDEDEAEAVPVLTKTILQKWQKAILEVRLTTFINKWHLNDEYIATIIESTSKTSHCFPFGCPHERRRSGRFMVHRQSRRYDYPMVCGRSAKHFSVYNKVITTALKYTPVVLDHHCPCKTLADGR